jgi:hypothetical protein
VGWDVSELFADRWFVTARAVVELGSFAVLSFGILYYLPKTVDKWWDIYREQMQTFRREVEEVRSHADARADKVVAEMRGLAQQILSATTENKGIMLENREAVRRLEYEVLLRLSSPIHRVEQIPKSEDKYPGPEKSS